MTRTTTTILVGDVRKRLCELPDNSVHCCVTSPPYWNLRDYGVPGQIGLEKTLDEWCDVIVAVFEEVRRVLHPSGTLWMNLGDSYANTNGKSLPDNEETGKVGNASDTNGEFRGGSYCQQGVPGIPDGMKAKDMMGQPWMVAFALRKAGWWLRSDIIWKKPNPMPGSATDRPNNSHEHLFLLAKRGRYYFDGFAVRERAVNGPSIPRDGVAPQDHKADEERGAFRGGSRANPTGAINPTRHIRDVWTINTEATRGSHFATYPQALVEPCVRAGTSEKGCCPICLEPWLRVTSQPKPPPEVYTGRTETGDDANVRSGSNPAGGDGERKGHGQKLQDWLNANPPVTTGWVANCECPPHDPVPCTVLDPFGGSGTTSLVSANLGRHSIMCELNPGPGYVEASEARLAALGTMFNAVFVVPVGTRADVDVPPAAGGGT